MTLEELADLIRANSANTNGRMDGVVGRIDGLSERVDDRIDGVIERVDGVVEHVRDLHEHIDRTHNETYSVLMNVQNGFTDVRGDVGPCARAWPTRKASSLA